MKKMLPFHEPHGHGTEVSFLRYVAVSDVHRVDAMEQDVPAYRDGTRSLIRGAPIAGKKDEYKFVYHATETAQALVAIMEGEEPCPK